MAEVVGFEPTLTNYLLHTGYNSAVLPFHHLGIYCDYTFFIVALSKSIFKTSLGNFAFSLSITACGIL